MYRHDTSNINMCICCISFVRLLFLFYQFTQCNYFHESYMIFNTCIHSMITMYVAKKRKLTHMVSLLQHMCFLLYVCGIIVRIVYIHKVPLHTNTYALYMFECVTTINCSPHLVTL